MILFKFRYKTAQTKILVICAVCCLLGFLGGWAVIRWRIKQFDKALAALLSEPDRSNAAQPPANPVPDYPLSTELKNALTRPSDFRLYRSVANIPGPVQSAFAKAVHETTFSMADPNGRWAATDVIEDLRLPRRRLAAVAISADLCLLFYERGGIGKSDNVAVFRQSHNRAEAVWHAYIAHDVTTPAALGKSLQEKSYQGSPFF